MWGPMRWKAVSVGFLYFFHVTIFLLVCDVFRFITMFNKKIFVNRTRSLRPYLQCVRDKFIDLMCSWHNKSVWVNFFIFSCYAPKNTRVSSCLSPKCLTLLVNFKNKTIWLFVRSTIFSPLKRICVFSPKQSLIYEFILVKCKSIAEGMTFYRFQVL